MSHINYTGQNAPVLSFSDLNLPEQQFIELYRSNEQIRDLANQFCQARKNLLDALNALNALNELMAKEVNHG